jgi:hypothetical protein
VSDQNAASASQDFANLIPIVGLIAGLTKTTSDDKVVAVAGQLLTNPTTGGILSAFFAFIGNLIHHQAKVTAPAPDTHPVPLTTPVPPPVAVAPAPTAAAVAGAGTFDEVATIKGHLGMIELPVRLTGGVRGVEDLPRRQEILAGANAHSGSRFHMDFSPFLANGTEIGTGDPRWATANRWAPNGCPVWLYYECDGLSTLDGHHSDNVEPGSVEDDMGCTPTFLVTGPAKVRFGAQYRRHDGTMVDSGLIGQGNVAGGEPFNVSQG